MTSTAYPATCQNSPTLPPPRHPAATSGPEPTSRLQRGVPGEDADAAAPTPGSTVTVQNVDLVESGSSAVYGPDHRQIGTVEQIFGGPDSGAPEWLTVTTSRVKDGGILVPLTGARLHAGDVIIAYTDDQLRHAPTIPADDDLTPSEAAQASAHYAQADKTSR